MSEITIPPAALEAGARKMQDLLFCNSTDGEQIARAACLAMLEAWPNKESLNKPSDWHRYVVLCISEKTDDKA